MLAILLVLAATAFPAPFYGRESLAGLRKYGVAVRVVCTGAISQHQDAFAAHLRNRLESRGIQVVPGGSVTLKLVATSIQSDDGFLVVHFALELDQSAALASNNRMADAPTWDAWKMGEYREDELLQEVDDLARQFLVDYIAAN